MGFGEVHGLIIASSRSQNLQIQKQNPLFSKQHRFVSASLRATPAQTSYRTSAISPQPSTTHTTGTSTVIMKYTAAAAYLPLRASDTISLIAVENVEKPPRKPVTNSRYDEWSAVW